MSPRIADNPYIAGAAIGGEHGFFGRESIFQEVEQTLLQPHNNAVVLQGQRRIGKTSILLQLKRRLPSSAFFPIYFDLMDMARRSTGYVLSQLAAAVAEEAHLPAPKWPEVDAVPAAFRDEFLPSLHGKLDPARRVVFLFDEFDTLEQEDVRSLPDNAAARALGEYVRGLMSTDQRLAFVFVVGRNMSELSHDFLPTVKAALVRSVSVLSPEETRALVRQAQDSEILHYDVAAVDRIVALTGGHPYLAQLMCQLLFIHAFQQSPTAQPCITVEQVEAMVPRVFEAGSAALQWIWKGIPPAERVVFSAIATQAAEGVVLNQDEVVAALKEAGIRSLMQELTLAPQTLVKWQLLEEVDGGYRFYVEILRRWVAQFQSLDNVKNELDRIDALADQLYRTALRFYEDGDMEQAIVELRRAQARNANHVKAHRLLGTIYRQQGLLPEALAQYEEAFRLDERDGRYDLVETLVQHGDALEKQGSIQDAVSAYKRVLAIVPREKTALTHLAALAERQGDEAMAAGRYSDAIASYREAQATGKQVLAQSRAAEVLEKSQEWAEALALYRELAISDPENKNWQTAIERADEEVKLSQDYEIGVQFLRDEEWKPAQDVLLKLLNRRPDYRDTVDLLAKATRRGERRYVVPYKEFWVGVGVTILSLVLLLSCLAFSLYRFVRQTNAYSTGSAGSATAVLWNDAIQATNAEVRAATRIFADVQSTLQAQTPRQSAVEATPVPVPSLTLTVPTVLPNAMETITSTPEITQSSNLATETVVARWTAEAEAWSSAVLPSPTQVGATNVVFEDDFTINDHGWTLRPMSLENGIPGWEIISGRLRTSTGGAKVNARWGISVPGLSVRNFLLSVEFTAISASAVTEVSVGFRSTADGKRYSYFCRLDGNCGGRDSLWWGPKVSPAFLPGRRANTLTVLAKDSTFNFYVNGQRMVANADTLLPDGGGILLIVESSGDAPATVDFDNLIIYSIP